MGDSANLQAKVGPLERGVKELGPLPGSGECHDARRQRRVRAAALRPASAARDHFAAFTDNPTGVAASVAGAGPTTWKTTWLTTWLTTWWAAFGGRASAMGVSMPGFFVGFVGSVGHGSAATAICVGR